MFYIYALFVLAISNSSKIVDIEINDVSIADTDSININFKAFNKTHDLTLVKNYFLGDNFTAFEYDNTPDIATVDVNNCYYISDQASFSFCDNVLSGTFYSDKLNETISVEPHVNDQYNVTRNVTIDLEGDWCDDTFLIPPHFESGNTKIQSVVKRAGNTATVELLVLADYTMYSTYTTQTAQHILDIVNYAASIYSQNVNTFSMPIVIQLNGVIVFTKPMISKFDTSSVLSSVHEFYSQLQSKTIFPSSRFDYIRNADHVSYYMTPSFIPSQVIGVAKTGAMCYYQESVSAVSEFNTAGAIPKTGYAFAHELGHSLNALHDGSGSSASCPSGINIMSPSIILALPSTFSSCSVSNMNSYLANVLSSPDKCVFKQAGYEITSSNVTLCGNGIVDVGEQCDAGGVSACCNADCTLKVNAQCDDSNGQCCSSCSLSSNTTVCRPYVANPYTDACTAPSERTGFCSGIDIYCPFKTYQIDGSLCSKNAEQGFCYEGTCYTRNIICASYGLTYGSCGTQNTCNVICNDASSNCIDVGFTMNTGSLCGIGFLGTCSGTQCIIPSTTNPLTTTTVKTTTKTSLTSTITISASMTSIATKPIDSTTNSDSGTQLTLIGSTTTSSGQIPWTVGNQVQSSIEIETTRVAQNLAKTSSLSFAPLLAISSPGTVPPALLPVSTTSNTEYAQNPTATTSAARSVAATKIPLVYHSTNTISTLYSSSKNHSRVNNQTALATAVESQEVSASYCLKGFGLYAFVLLLTTL